MKITIATLLCASAACLGYVFITDAPTGEFRKQVESGDARAPRLQAGTSRQAPVLETVPDDRTETVLGIRVRKDRNCTVDLREYVTPDGEMFSAYSCAPERVPPQHPYAHYDNDSLAAMAYADAEAAALLGKRLIGTDTARSYELLIRASALDGGKVGHLAWLADQAFGTLEINGKPEVKNIERQYALATLAARLGDTSRKSAYFRNELIRAGIDADRLGLLDEQVETLLQSMRDIQRNVLGEVTIGGHGDA